AHNSPFRLAAKIRTANSRWRWIRRLRLFMTTDVITHRMGSLRPCSSGIIVRCYACPVRLISGVIALMMVAASGLAQQRPLLTEDPRLIPVGSLDVETGIGYARDAVFTISGLRGDHVALFPTALNFGLGDRAEFQIGGVVQDFLKSADGVWHKD